MANDAKPGHENPEEPDPLSATAMFLRAVDDSPPQELETTGHIAEKPSAGSGSTPAPRSVSSQSTIEPPKRGSAKAAAQPGEFTQIFGEIREMQASADDVASARAKTEQPASPGTPAAGLRADESPGEFTRIFVKVSGASASRADDGLQPKKSEVPGRAKGFSSPGVSDAASADSTFAQFFKASAGTGPSASSSGKELDEPIVFRVGADASAQPDEVPPGLSSKPSPAQGADHSITELIAHLSSDKRAPTNPKDTDMVPYREESRHPFVPEMRNSPLAGVDSGGVTQILQRLSSEPPRPIIEGPPPVRLEPAPQSGPGEFTRMVSRDDVNASIGAPAVAPPAQPAPAALASPFTPVTPAIPQMKAPVVAAPSMPATAPAQPQFVAPAMPVMPALAVPAPPKPAAPAPAPAASRSKLEAMVPFLLLINTFLLVVLLVVVIFLIKTR